MLLLLFLLCGSAYATTPDQPEKAVVSVPVADVWSRVLTPGEKPADELRETQVLSGEMVLIQESSGPWVRIEAIEQPEFTHRNFWEGYPGWMRKDALGPIKADLQPPPRGLRDIIAYAKSVVGTPYLWGGLSPKGFDCSGLVHLAYRQHQMKIPRDAYEQWLKAKHTTRQDLKVGDLIFSAKADNPKKVTHVALYAGNGLIIEAPQTGMVVREIPFKEKYGKDFYSVESGDKVGERVIYFGSFQP